MIGFDDPLLGYFCLGVEFFFLVLIVQPFLKKGDTNFTKMIHFSDSPPARVLSEGSIECLQRFVFFQI